MTRASVLVLFAALASCSPKKSREAASETIIITLPASAASAIDFSWRKQQGDFPQDKPGYLILTTEDALTYSKFLPEFVKQKESMGFHVYVATEKDYGTGKTGNAQAKQVREWMREFHKRAGIKYALLIGNSNPRSTDLPAHSIPDGERGGIDAPYADLDGKWVDLYLNATPEQVRANPNSNGQGSIILSQAWRSSGARADELIVSRINYVGNEIGNGAYDLDRILEKTIRYERDTEAGKNLDWRANALSCTTNYGSGNWDTPWLKAIEAEGGRFELRSSRGPIGELPPQNLVDGLPVNAELLTQSQRRGLLAHMSHAWNRGAEGIADNGQILRDTDPRYPSAIAIAGCTSLALADGCHMGQAWLRSGAIFAMGTSWSGNNNSRVPFHTRMLKERVSVGEAGKSEVIQYGDPSLHVLPPKGAPVRALQISPATPGYYEERTLYPNTQIKPLTQTYTLTNRSKDSMTVKVETNAPWIAFSTTFVALKPGESTQVTATSNRKASTLAPGKHVADVRFSREDGQVDHRSLSLALQPLSITACYSFDAIEKAKQFPDLTIVPGNNRDVRSMQLVRKAAVTPENKNPGMEPIPGFAFDPQGKVGGAVRLDKPVKGWSRGRAFGTQWRGISTSFWFKLVLSVDAAGLLTFAGNGKPGNLGTIKVGEWHFVQLRTDFANGKAKASLDGAPEIITDATKVAADTLSLGSFTGSVDELKTWSGELTNADVTKEFAAASQSFAPAPVEAVAGLPLAEGGEVSAPKEIPAVLEMKDATVKLDIASALAANQLTCTLRDAPEWLDFKDGVFSLKPGTDFDRIDFGGYDLFLVLTAKDGPFAGCVCEHTLKVRIPIPEVRMRIARAADNTLSFVSAGGDKRPLGKGVIRYTTDGSPVTVNSPVYEKPFKTDGDKVTARFFYLGEYPYMPVTMNSEFGITREKWKPLSVTGHPGTLAASANVFDGKSETAWTHKGEKLPQALAWDLGEAVTMTALSCHSTIANSTGRISDYVVHASGDGKTWRQVHSGKYADSPGAQRIELEKPCTARYLKLEATALYGGKDMVLAELEVYSR
jgi:hypothetical protein